MNKKINTPTALAVIIATAAILGGLIWLNGRNIKIETPTISITEPSQKQKAVNQINNTGNEQLPEETQFEKLSYTSNRLGVSFDYEVTGNKTTICESGNFIFDIEGDSCPKSKEDITLALSRPDVALEVFSKNQNQSLETSIKSVLAKEGVDNSKCAINISDKIFADPSMGPDNQDANRKIAKVFASGKTCSFFDSETPDCKYPQDICPSKYLNNELSTLSNYFIYNPTESTAKFVFHQCDCYETMPNISRPVPK